MKKYLSHILTMALIAPALVSCTERVEEVSPESLKHTVSFATADEAATKTGLAIEGSTIVPNWKQTSIDDVHLFEIDATSKTMGTTTAIQPSSDNLTARFTAEFSNAPGTYKYGAVVAKMNAENAFFIPAEQHPDAATLKDPAAEFLVGYSRFEYTAPTGDDDFLVDLFFDRVAALSRIGFTSFAEDDQKVMSVTIKSDKSMTGSATIDKIVFGNPSTVEFTPDGNAGVMTLSYGEGADIPTDKPFYAYFVSMPGTFTITSIEVQTDKNHYVKSVGTEVKLNLTELKNLKLNLTGSVIPVQSVTVDPTSLDMKVGDKKTVSATVLPENASDRSVIWSSNNESVATVDASSGEVTAIAQGEARITATTVDGGKTASCTVTVSDAYDFRLEITPVKGVIKVGDELTYTVKLYTKINNGEEQPSIVEDAVLTSDQSGIVTFDGYTVTGVSKGDITITASCQPEHATEAITAEATLTVNDAHEYSLAITAADDKTEIKHNETLAYTATLTTITNGDTEHPATRDVTEEVEWESTNESAATINGAGIATGVAEGSTFIKATYTPDDANAVSDELTLNVKNVHVYSLAITAADDKTEIKHNETLAYTATLTTITNGDTEHPATRDVTEEVVWESTNMSAATIDEDGIATGVAEGSTNIKATYTPDDANAVSDELTLNVKNVYEYEVTISPTSEDLPRIIIGNELTFTLTLMTKVNGGTPTPSTILGNDATWETSAPTVATVTNGVVTGKAEGTAHITATYKDANNEDHILDVLIAVTKDPNHAGDVISVGTEEEL